jgi:hypothetical protein
MRLAHFYGHTGGAPISYFRFKIFAMGPFIGGNFRIYTDRKIEKISVTNVVKEGGGMGPVRGFAIGAQNPSGWERRRWGPRQAVDDW